MHILLLPPPSRLASASLKHQVPRHNCRILTLRMWKPSSLLDALVCAYNASQAGQIRRTFGSRVLSIAHAARRRISFHHLLSYARVSSKILFCLSLTSPRHFSENPKESLFPSAKKEIIGNLKISSYHISTNHLQKLQNFQTQDLRSSALGPRVNGKRQ